MNALERFIKSEHSRLAEFLKVSPEPRYLSEAREILEEEKAEEKEKSLAALADEKGYNIGFMGRHFDEYVINLIERREPISLNMNQIYGKTCTDAEAKAIAYLEHLA